MEKSRSPGAAACIGATCAGKPPRATVPQRTAPEASNPLKFRDVFVACYIAIRRVAPEHAHFSKGSPENYWGHEATGGSLGEPQGDRG